MKNKIVYIADKADDVDDIIAIEYLLNINMLKCVVVDYKPYSYGVKDLPTMKIIDYETSFNF